MIVALCPARPQATPSLLWPMELSPRCAAQVLRQADVDTCAQGLPHVVGMVHLVAAALLLAAMAVYCMAMFTRVDTGAARSAGTKARFGKTGRNRFYFGCGAVVLAACAGLLANFPWPDMLGPSTLLIWETVGILAFGLAWLVKGLQLSPMGGQSALRAGGG